MQPAQPRPRFARRQRRVEERRRHAARLQRIHLVLHQRDQRRHHHRQPLPRHRRQLEAERFAAARRQQGKHVLARQRIADDLLLQRAEGREAEVLLQQRQELQSSWIPRGGVYSRSKRQCTRQTRPTSRPSAQPGYFAEVAADVSRRILSPANTAPTHVGGYCLPSGLRWAEILRRLERMKTRQLVGAAGTLLLEENLEFGFATAQRAAPDLKAPLAEQLRSFNEFGKDTQVIETAAATFGGERLSVPTYVNEFWTSKQRAASSLHEVSYRACFKPQLPRFFIERLTEPGEMVYDPFMGRGTTIIEAGLLGRVPCGCDVNPLSVGPDAPQAAPAGAWRKSRDGSGRWITPTRVNCPRTLLVFYHPETLREICALRRYLIRRSENGTGDLVDDWIRMVAVNRLTGHSPGFFSVYTLPPNQAVSVKSQRKINADRARRSRPGGMWPRSSAARAGNCWPTATRRPGARWLPFRAARSY